MSASFLFFHGVAERPKIRRAPQAGPVSPPDFIAEKTDVFFEELFQQAGLAASAYRDTALKRRIPACLRFLRTPNLEAARLKLKQSTKLTAEALSVVLLGVTEFCRDPVVFDHLRELVLPRLTRLAQPLRIWSAACSDGRELYSISILLNEAGLEGFELLGTDCRLEAIEAARQGLFPMESLDKLEPTWKNHFISVQNQVQVATHLKKNLRWQQSDLLAGTQRGPWHMILWRNMAIYLKPEVAERIWLGLIEELAPGGYLVSGKADHLPRHPALEKISNCIYRKKAA